jgi:hypothetical protein
MIAVIQIPILHRMVLVALATFFLCVTVEMIRRRKLKEEYAMLWLGASLLLVVLAIFPWITFWLNRTLGINYLTLVVIACFLFLAVIVMHYATVLSAQSEHIRQLAQQIALLRQKLHKPEAEADQDKEHADPPADDSVGGDKAEGGDGG